MKASPVKVAKSRIIDGWDARVGTECRRCGLLLVTGGHRNAGCNFGAVCGKKSKQSHAQSIDVIRVDAGQNRSNFWKKRDSLVYWRVIIFEFGGFN